MNYVEGLRFGLAKLKKGTSNIAVGAAAMTASTMALADDPASITDYMGSVSLVAATAVVAGIVGVGIVWELVFKGQKLGKRAVKGA